MGHYLSSLLLYTDQITNQPVTPKLAQIYIVDPDMQQRATRRNGIFSDLCPVALGDIEAMMAEHNPLAQQFLTFGERLRVLRASGGDIVDVRFRLHENRSRPGTYNLPTVSEVDATMIEDGNLDQPRDIILYAKDHRLFRLYEIHATYDRFSTRYCFRTENSVGRTLIHTTATSCGGTSAECLFANT
ncbi:hypothetical protein PC129_g23188 [Phytophthora cactorum]|uniref:Uncharacterized protein n=1 Tax=Phytophthora cactorum TaxID=29920 RepID=A0A8T1AJF4_9STRA|nr:hypothetical protein Pcac1_g17343 [Phytophthora cactorum]KAG2871894.1 hypothetical protein PC114_g26675 [Phytophthora cactorum]KAG2880517.1 hypothetical protein PC117_g26548 [Phytophthora cactorum]KAG2964437.1 hypothetical protein PC119_g25249 [Phytophthora cactorum]KAG3202614.1 hypothetical protein PC129_g23188 [Phytophthora cactorum]